MDETKLNTPELFSVLTCPECGHNSRDKMPENACQYFYDCAGCGAVLKPLPGDCCVYCSYGDIKCPPIQLGGSPCAAGTALDDFKLTP